jgi:hypothetical protein
MPRFFLNIREGDELIVDVEGADFLSIAEATAEAVLSARELMANSILAGRNPGGSRFEIRDESGLIVLIMPFEEAIGSA